MRQTREPIALFKFCAPVLREMGARKSAIPQRGLHASGARKGRSRGGRGEMQPDGGRKEYTDKEGRCVKVLEWFGHKLHLLCDTRQAER